MTHLLENLQSYAEDLIETHKIPAVSIAVWHKNKLYKAAAGILNIETRVRATTDSIFQIGSITKVFTACLVMQLVDEGRVELDKPVKDYIRDFQVADSEATKIITVGQLLSHTSGLEGDFYPDDTLQTGNLIARYLDRCSLLPQVHEPCQGFSYSNAGYAIAGRLVEVVLGISFFQAIEERIYKPLGMSHSVANPINTLRYRAAMGHVPNLELPNQWALAPICYSCMGLAPAGRLTMSASDLIIFAKAHLNRGRTESGQHWLSADNVTAMQRPNVALPPYSPAQVTHWGLGWSLINELNQSHAPIVGHTGQTFGQSALLELFPQQNMAFAALANVGGGGVLRQVFNDLLLELADTRFKAPDTLKVLQDASRFTGQFEALGYCYQITLENQQLVATVIDKVLSSGATKIFLKPIDDNAFAGYSEDDQFAGNFIFLNADKGSIPQSIFTGCRLTNRV